MMQLSVCYGCSSRFDPTTCIVYKILDKSRDGYVDSFYHQLKNKGVIALNFASQYRGLTKSCYRIKKEGDVTEYIFDKQVREFMKKH